eukprot:GEMP01007154.1.p1 GENE.GEMP01007154.1~~GEMP01007154.1.p1  ORF type:complete len:735 (+),score=139.92 GEMP01007154.1:230-2434(+)
MPVVSNLGMRYSETYAEERIYHETTRALRQIAGDLSRIKSPPSRNPPKSTVYTGIGVPMCFNNGVRAAECTSATRPEPMGTTSDTLFDDIVRREARRIQNPQLMQNRIVYDSVDPNPMRPDARVTGTVDKMPRYYEPTDLHDTTLVFESRFEAGNLRRAVQVQEFEYDLILNPDYNTKSYTQWFYFSVSNTRVGVPYRFNIINMVKSTSLYSEGMRPLMLSTKGGKKWVRTGSNIAYYQNGIRRKEKGNYFTITFTVEFPDNGMVYLAHSEPYTYSDLQAFLNNLEEDPKRAQHVRFRRRKLCETLAGNTCDLITITSFGEDPALLKERRGVVFTARVHPGETSASWIMKGVLEYLTSSSTEAKKLRDNFVFKIVPMLNPDGVVVGNYRSSLCGLDLNRQWQEPSKRLTPTIFFVKQMIQRLCEDREVVLYMDIHGHSKKKNIFMYGNLGPSSVKEKIFPRLLSKALDYFSFPDCSFQVKKNKESTARAVVYNEFDITNSYTLEASLCGADTGHLAECHFNRTHLEQMGWRVCDGILELCDPAKVMQAVKELGALHFENNSACNSDSDADKDASDAKAQFRARNPKKTPRQTVSTSNRSRQPAVANDEIRSVRRRTHRSSLASSKELRNPSKLGNLSGAETTPVPSTRDLPEGKMCSKRPKAPRKEPDRKPRKKRPSVRNSHMSGRETPHDAYSTRADSTVAPPPESIRSQKATPPVGVFPPLCNATRSERTKE